MDRRGQAGPDDHSDAQDYHVAVGVHLLGILFSHFEQKFLYVRLSGGCKAPRRYARIVSVAEWPL